MTRQEHDGGITVIANSFQGRQLNRPNDVVVKSDGCIYFTSRNHLGAVGVKIAGIPVPVAAR